MAEEHNQKYDVLFDGFDSLCKELLSEEKIDVVVDLISYLANGTWDNPEFVGRKLFYPQLDQAIVEVARLLRVVENDYFMNDSLQVIIGSKFYTTGGHTRAARGFCRLAANNLIIVTDYFQDTSASDMPPIKDIFFPYPVVFLPPATEISKIKFTINLLKTLGPKKISCFNHFQDPIPLVSMAAIPSAEKTYYHHCDFQPSLGATMKDFRHIDTTEGGNSICRGFSSATDPFSAPIPTDFLCDFDLIIKEDEVLNTVTMGSRHKYEITSEKTSGSYPHMLVSVMRHTLGKHYHIGPLSKEDLAIIEAALSSQNLNKNSFIYLGAVPQGVRCIEKIINPLYIPSFPLSGGLSNLEMISTGVPFLVKKVNKSADELTIHDCNTPSTMPQTCAYWYDDSSLLAQIAFIKDNYEKICVENKKIYQTRFSFEAFLNRMER